MKIAVYGISCSGKDTFINELTKNFPSFTHIKGSKKLNLIALEKYSSKFRELDLQKQDEIRKQFIQNLIHLDNIVVDGHYSFPEDKNYRITFTDFDKGLYDIFIYLRANPTEVKKRINNSDKNFQYKILSVQDIENWQLKEISELRDICFKENKEFIVLDEDFKKDLEFLNEYFCQYPKMTTIEIARKIANCIMERNGNTKKVALFDCDRTIVKEDTTLPFFELNGGKKKVMKKIFYGGGYTSYQFWKQQELYKDFSIFPNATSFNKNQQVVSKLKILKENGYVVYGLTSGVYRIWNSINEEYNLFDKVIGNNLQDDSFGIITDFVKGYVVKLLQEKGYSVFATGDSMCDIYMLEVCGGLIWAPEKIRSSIQDYINNHKQTKIKQYKNNPIKYLGVEEIE